MSMEFRTAFTVFEGGNDKLPKEWEKLNRGWERNCEGLGFLACAGALLLRSWKVQSVALACFVAARLLRDVRHLNTHTWEKPQSAGWGSTSQEDPVSRVKKAVEQVPTLFLSWVSDPAWKTLISHGFFVPLKTT